MSIRVQCPACQQAYNLADEMQGKKIRCKKCTHPFVVEEPQEEAVPTLDEVEEETPDERAVKTRPGLARPSAGKRPADRRDEDDDDRPRPRRRYRDDDERDDEEGGGSSKGLLLGLIGGGIALVLLIGGGLAWMFLPGTPAPVSSPSVPSIAQANPPPAGNNPNVNSNPNPVPNPNPRPNPPIVQPDPVVWAVRVDPGPARKELAEPNGSLPLGQNQAVLYSSRLSPFVAVGDNITDQSSRQVWNLETMKQVGTIPGKLTASDPMVLSPDGKYLAGQTFKIRELVIDVVFAEDGRPAQTLQIAKGIASISFFEFAGTDQLVVVKHVNLKRVLEVWSLTTGQVLRQINLNAFPIDTKSNTAISPGGRYLAAFESNKILFYDLEKGEAAGVIRVSPGPGFQMPKALAFSPDGKDLGQLFDGGTQPRLLLHDVATGKQGKGIDLPKNIHYLSTQSSFYAGPALQWLPDRSGWLAFGFYIIDNPSGGVVYTVPANLEIGFPTRREVVDKDHLAVVIGNGNARRIQIMTLPREQIDRATKAARTGQDPATASLPALKPTNWSAVRQIAEPNGAIEWKVEADALIPKKTTRSPIPLPVKGSEINRILFASASGQAAVLSQSKPEGVLVPQQVRAECYDLASGESRGGLDLFSASDIVKPGTKGLVADLSPQGGYLAVVEPGSARRVDVWSLGEKKHFVAWNPLDGDQSQTITWVGFADEKRLLTISSTGKLVAWTIADCKAEYAVSGLKGTTSLSPGRKYLAGWDGRGVTFLDVATGERRGQLRGRAGTNLRSCYTVAFHLNGSALAGLCGTDTGSKLVTWNLKSGEATAEVGALGNQGTLEWAGDKHLLSDGTLFDLALKAPIMHYSLPGFGKHAPGGPDGRHWFASGQGAEGKASLVGQTLPDPAALKLTADLTKPGTQILLKPGMKLSVQVVATGSLAKLDQTRESLLRSIQQELRNAGLEVVDGMPLTLRVTLTEQPTGMTHEYTEIGQGRQTVRVSVKQITCQSVLTGRGGIVWQQRQVFQTQKATSFATDDPQQYFDEQLWNSARGWASAFGKPPTFIVRIGGKLGSLPLNAVLTGGR